MLGILNTVQSKGSAFFQFIKEGLVMANRFLTPPSLSHPANGSAEFDGASDYVDTGINIDTTESMTFGAWVYRADDSTARAIAGDGFPSGGEAGFSLITITANTDLYISYGSTSRTASSILPALNEWYYLTTSFNSGIMKVYINGSEVYESSYANANPQHDRSIFIGCRRGQGSPYGAIQFWDGNLANVAIWNRALSSDEINSVMWKGYSQLNTSELNGLQAWYSLTESESLVGDDTATLEKYAQVKGLTFEGKTCLQNALNAFPDITDARLYSANYDIRVSADGGSIEALSCVETELNALLV